MRSEKKRVANRQIQFDNIDVKFKIKQTKLYAIFGGTHVSKPKKIPNSGEWLILGGREGQKREMRSRRGTHKRLQMDSKRFVGWKKWSETNAAKCSDLTKLGG